MHMLEANLFHRRSRWAFVAFAAALALTACSHKHKDKPAPATAPAQSSDAAPASSGFSTGTFGTKNNNSNFVSNDQPPAPMEQGSSKFSVPPPASKTPPALASVPSKVPTPPTNKQDREKAVEGLIADRERAQYSNTGGRATPVVVRPLTEAQAQTDPEPAAPPKPAAAQVGAVTRLGDQPAAGSTPPSPADHAQQQAAVDAAAQVAATAVPPPPPADMATGPRPSVMPVARTDGFRALASYADTPSASNQVATVDFSGTGSSISAIARRALSDAAQLGERNKDRAFRVIGHSAQPNNLVQDRATAVARELQRLGVAQDRIYVGTDTGPDGRVDVILDQ